MMTTSPAQPARTAGTASTNPAHAVQLGHLHKTFGPVTAVDDLSLQIKHGEIVALLGPNGAGKTSTIDMMLGLSTPSGGDVSILGMRPQEAVARGLICAVMQTGGLLKDYTVEETVELTASLFSQTHPISEVIERAGLSDIRTRKVGKCSGGEQQRLRFAMALIPDPMLLILDEPTTGMDVEGRREFWAAIRDDAKRGRTVIFATHYLEEADAYADRIVMVRKGRIVADGTSAEIKGLSSGRVVRAVVGAGNDVALWEIPGVDNLDRHGDAVTITTSKPDDVARHLLTQTDAHDLEISSHNLEDAFVALTSDDRQSGDQS